MRPGHQRAGRGHRLGDADAGQVVVLHQHGVGQAGAVVGAAAGAHRRLLEGAQAGRRLAGVEDPGRRVGGRAPRRRTARVSVATPDRWQRKLSAVRSAVRIERSGARHLHDRGAGRHLAAVGDVPDDARPRGRPARRPRARTARPATTPSCRGHARELGGRRRPGTSAAVRSPSGRGPRPGPAPRRRATAPGVRHGSVRVGRLRRSRRARGRRVPVDDAAAPRRVGVGVVAPGVGARGSRSAPQRGASSAPARRQRLASSPAPPGAGGRAERRRASPTTASARRASDAARAAPRRPRSWPAAACRAAWPRRRRTGAASRSARTRSRRPAAARRRRTDTATRSPSIGASPQDGRAARRSVLGARRRPPRCASASRAPNTMPSSSEFDARRLAPCTPVQATSPTAHSPGSALRPVEVGDHAARQVVGGRGDRQPVHRGVEPGGGSEAATVGNRSPKDSSPVASSHRCPTPWAAIRSGHGPADHVARRQLVDEPLARRVAQQRPVAAQRLGQQRPGHGRMVQRGRVELDELDVGHRAPRPAAPWRCRRRWPRAGWWSPRRAGPRPRWPAPPGRPAPPPGRRPPGSRAGTPTHRPPSTRRSRANHCSSTAPAVAHGRVDERPLDLGPGGRAAGVQDTRAVEWPPSRASARSPPASRSNTAPSAISSSTRPGPSSTSTRTASTSHSPAPAARVSARWRSVESSSPPSTAATPPWAQRVADWASVGLGQHPHPQARRGRRARRPGAPRRTGRPRRCRGRARRGSRPAPRRSRRSAQRELGVEAGRGLVDHPVGGVHVDDGGPKASSSAAS